MKHAVSKTETDWQKTRKETKIFAKNILEAIIKNRRAYIKRVDMTPHYETDFFDGVRSFDRVMIPTDFYTMTLYYYLPPPKRPKTGKSEALSASKAIGGRARAKALSPERRRQIAKKAALTRWAS